MMSWIRGRFGRRGRAPLALALAVSLLTIPGLGRPASAQVPGVDPNQAPGFDPNQGPGGPGGPGPEVLARGPIHEAFASPVVFNPTPGVVVPKAPPQTAIEEVPPDQKPEGADVEWVPGYWAYDDERQDYIWISGIWRDIPPGRQWIPGYWNPVPGGFQWTSGFWGPSAASGPINYLPAPPESLEVGPNTPQPGPNFSWAPGCWLWTDDHYVWRPGSWIPSQQDWVWEPGNYIATPNGYVYNGGYWDYNLAQRGVPFAPVAFGQNVYSQPNYAYRPGVTLAVGGLLSSLFVRPSYGSYYFGDYYGAVGQGARPGFYPWFNYQNRVGYDPIYASYAARNGGQPGWDRGYREQYEQRVRDVSFRPPATYAAQRGWIERQQGRGENVRNLALAQPLNQWSQHHPDARPLIPVGQDHRQELNRRQQSINEFSQARARQENQPQFREANQARLRQEGQARLQQENQFRGQQENEARGRLENQARLQQENQGRAQQENQARLRQENQGRQAANIQGAERRPQQMDLSRSPIHSAGEPKFQSRGLAEPPPHAQPHPGNLGGGQAPHREPGPAQPRNEARPNAGASPHPAPAAPRGGEHERGGKPK